MTQVGYLNSSLLLRSEVGDGIDFISSNNSVRFIHRIGLPCRRQRLLLYKIMQSNSYKILREKTHLVNHGIQTFGISKELKIQRRRNTP